MTHWAEKYIGIPYVEGEQDCAWLAEKVTKEVFGKVLNLPKDRPYMEHTKDAPIARWHATRDQIDGCKADFARRVDSPKEGDAVILKARGYFQHIGMYCLIAGEDWILHHNDSFGASALTRVRDLAIRGLEVEGYYRWI